jgi:hypothetical protein
MRTFEFHHINVARWARVVSRGAACLVVAAVVAGCGAGGLNIPDPIPDDRRDIPPPKKRKIIIPADGFDMQVARQAEQFFDLSRHFRKLANKPKQAFNIDAFDEVPNSSWYTNRNARQRMSLEEIARGADTENGPSLSGTWTITGAKTEGVTPGFNIKDSDGKGYVIKFDPKGYPELATGAELVGTKLFYAAGYNTPENYIVRFDPSLLRIGDDTEIKDKTGKKRPMTQADLDLILDSINHMADGRIRAVASKFLEGKLIGPFKYHKMRKDDPNDFIPHEHRRELRGLRLMAAWLNHFDTKANNSLDVYVTENGRSFVKHYLIDFGSTLGSQGDEPMPLWTGYENTVDPHQIMKNTLGLGLYVPGWERGRSVHYPSIGLIDTKGFHPQKYKYIIPNLAFENLTDRDGFWGARLVMSFTDEQIETAVAQGEYSDPEAAAYLSKIIIERRNIVGRYWFNKVSSLDRFEVMPGARPELRFTDLAVESGIWPSDAARYRYEILRDGIEVSEEAELNNETRIPLPPGEGGTLEVRVSNMQQGGKWSEWVSVYVVANPSGEYSLIALKRHD